MIQDRGLTPSTCNVALSAFKLFYEQILSQQPLTLSIPFQKRPKRLPVCLNRDELLRLFRCTENQKHRLMLMTAYSTGGRVSELVRIKLSDIDTCDMTLRINQGKGKKIALPYYLKNYLPR